MNLRGTRLLLIALAIGSSSFAADRLSAQELSSAQQIQARVKPPRQNADLISGAEIQTATQSDALALIQSLRPRWLRTRGATSFNRSEIVQVYVDGMPMGGPRALSQIQAQSVSSIRFLDGRAATQRFGVDHGAGAILVSIRH